MASNGTTFIHPFQNLATWSGHDSQKMGSKTDEAKVDVFWRKGQRGWVRTGVGSCSIKTFRFRQCPWAVGGSTCRRLCSNQTGWTKPAFVQRIRTCCRQRPSLKESLSDHFREEVLYSMTSGFYWLSFFLKKKKNARHWFILCWFLFRLEHLLLT